jgi:hypothetical protein
VKAGEHCRKCIHCYWDHKTERERKCNYKFFELKAEKLSKRDVVIICGGTRDAAKNETKDGLRSVSKFARRTADTNVIITCVPHRFDLQPASCVNNEVESFHKKLRKQIKFFDYIQVCSIRNNRARFTTH